jgi:hypothetical protein
MSRRAGVFFGPWWLLATHSTCTEENTVQRVLGITLAVVFVAGAAVAQTQGQGRTQSQQQQQNLPMDLEKMGPWTRKPTNEQRTSKEVSDFFKQEEEIMKRGDFNAVLARVDFPVFMATDDSRGMPSAKEYGREEYMQMMRPFFESMPKDIKVTHKPNVTVLSDSMASIVDDFTMNTGKQKLSGRSIGLLVKRDGQWKWKAMAEPGWGDMAATGAYGGQTQGTKQPH